MEYKQTPLSLVVRGLTLWWWLGIATFGLLIAWDVISYLRTKLILREKSLTLYFGVLTQNSQELPYRSVQTVDVHQSVFGQVFGYGHIIITSANALDPIVFKYVNKPQALRRVIQDRIAA